MSRKFRIGQFLVLLSCHWRMKSLWKWPPFYLSAKPVRSPAGQTLGFTSLFIGCEFAVLRVGKSA